MASRRLPAVHDGPRPDAETSNRECTSLTASSNSAGSMTRAVAALGPAPDQCVHDEAARQIWDRFAQRLSALVRQRLNAKIRVREDENDIVQSMFASFFTVQQNQGYALKNREELWRFLVWMTMCKVANAATSSSACPPRYSSRAIADIFRRNRRLQCKLDCGNRRSQSDLAGGCSHLAHRALARILRRLSKDLRQILVWKLKDYTNKEIGRKIDRTGHRGGQDAAAPADARSRPGNSRPVGEREEVRVSSNARSSSPNTHQTY